MAEVEVTGKRSEDAAFSGSGSKTPGTALSSGAKSGLPDGFDTKFENFPEDLNKQMIDAVIEVYKKLLDQNECAGVDLLTRGKMITSLKKATFIYRPNLDQETIYNGGICGYTPLRSLLFRKVNDIHIGARAFTDKGCHSLAQTIMHELPHLKRATDSTAEDIEFACYPKKSIAK